VPEDFREIAAAPAENVKVARVRVAFQLLLHLKSRAVQFSILYSGRAIPVAADV
jgi:hypothetical protein